MRAGSGAAGGEQLGQVVGGADQRPLGLDLAEAAQQELAEPRACLLWPITGSTVCLRNR